MTTYVEVGTKEGLEGRTLERYVEYMLKRWKEEQETQCQTGYASEWARRFKSGIEYAASDIFGQMVLDSMKTIVY